MAERPSGSSGVSRAAGAGRGYGLAVGVGLGVGLGVGFGVGVGLRVGAGVGSEVDVEVGVGVGEPGSGELSGGLPAAWLPVHARQTGMSAGCTKSAMACVPKTMA